jgi:malate/lactate dehydrogenase
MTKKKPQSKEDPLNTSTYKIIVVGGGGVGKHTSFLLITFTISTTQSHLTDSLNFFVKGKSALTIQFIQVTQISTSSES